MAVGADGAAWRRYVNTTTTSSTINIGTLNVDMYDVAARTKSGRRSQQDVGSGKDPAKVNKNLNKAMESCSRSIRQRRKVNPLRVAGCDGPSRKYPH